VGAGCAAGLVAAALSAGWVTAARLGPGSVTAAPLGPGSVTAGATPAAVRERAEWWASVHSRRRRARDLAFLNVLGMCLLDSEVRRSSYQVFDLRRTMMVVGRLHTLDHPARDELELEEVLHALSDPARLRIVAALAADGGERACGSLGCSLAKSTMTHHFKVLRETGVVAQRDVGTSRMTCLRREDLDARFPGLLNAVLSAAEAAA
jgi:DNA-binding transcriptional ArsR family regulator